MTNEGTDASVDNVARNVRSCDDLFGDASDGDQPTTTTTTTDDPFSSIASGDDVGNPFGDATPKTDIASSSPTGNHPNVEGNLLGDPTLKVEGSSPTSDSLHNNEGNPFGRSATMESSDDVRDLRRLLSELAAYNEESETLLLAESRAVRAEQLVTISAEARRDLVERSGDEAGECATRPLVDGRRVLALTHSLSLSVSLQ